MTEPWRRSAGKPLRFQFARLHLIDVAPDPALGGLDRADERVSNVFEVFRRMLVFRRIATSDVAADQAHAQVDPAISHLYALFANMLGGLRKFDFVEMSTSRSH